MGEERVGKPSSHGFKKVAAPGGGLAFLLGWGLPACSPRRRGRCPRAAPYLLLERCDRSVGADPDGDARRRRRVLHADLHAAEERRTPSEESCRARGSRHGRSLGTTLPARGSEPPPRSPTRSGGGFPTTIRVSQPRKPGQAPLARARGGLRPEPRAWHAQRARLPPAPLTLCSSPSIPAGSAMIPTARRKHFASFKPGASRFPRARLPRAGPSQTPPRPLLRT